jgi:hypothetical protein
LRFRLKKIAFQLLSAPTPCPAAETELEEIASAMEMLRSMRMEEWGEFRKGITPCRYDKMYHDSINVIRGFPDLVRKHGRMCLRLCLPDQYSAEYCRISLKYDGKWREEKTGVLKCVDNLSEAFYRVFIPVEKTESPEAVRFECEGYGGQGLAYVEIINDAGRFIPEKLTAVKGKATDPEFVLSDDCKWCFLGDKDTLSSFRNRSLAQAKHSVEYKLKRTDI